jgi:hypothetical protein
MTFEKINEDKSYWLKKDGEINMTWNIFNPSGPTLNCIGTFKTEDENIEVVFYRWLHFLEEGSYILGYVDRNKDDSGQQFSNILKNAFCFAPKKNSNQPLLVTCIPSIVTSIFPEDWKHVPWILLFNSPVIQQADWGRELYYLKKYSANLFDRAGEEAREAVQQLKTEFPEDDVGIKMAEIRHSRVKTFTDKEPIVFESLPISDELCVEFRDILSEGEFITEAMINFSKAWVGAIHMVDGRKPTLIEFEDVRDFLAHYKHQIWGQEFTTENIRKAIGLT